jgi:hypothetical protein
MSLMVSRLVLSAPPLLLVLVMFVTFTVLKRARRTLQKLT